MKKKLHTCELCGETDKDVEMFVGGPFSWLHDKCAKIADKAIAAHYRSLATMEGGLIYFANEIIEAEKNIRNSNKSRMEKDE